MAKGCPSEPKNNHTLGKVFPQPKSFRHYVRCCKKDSVSELITECTSSLDRRLHIPGTSRCLSSAVTYDAAVEICEDNEMSLCSSADLDLLCCGTGCGYDTQWVWVSNQGIIRLSL